MRGLASKLRWLPTLTLSVLAAPGWAQDPEAPTAEVVFYSPPANKPALGTVDFHVDVLASEEVEEVRLRVDGRDVKSFRTPPYSTPIELGPENREHRFEVLVLGRDRELARRTRRTPAIRIDSEVTVGLRQLYLTVSRRGERVADLVADDFTVIDSGQPQTTVTFEGGDAAITALLLVDASLSMKGRPLQAAVGAAKAFVRQLNDLDEAALLLFSDRPLFDSEFVADPSRFDERLESLVAGGGTAINDHLFLALKRLAGRQGRRVIVLLSDGVDVESVLQMSEVLWMLRRTDTLIYWIRLTQSRDGASPDVVTSWRSIGSHREERAQLRAAVEESGGRVVPIATAGEATVAFEEIRQELRQQYVIGYYPSDVVRDGRWRPVTVRVRDPGVRVRMRSGYIDD